MLKRTFIFSIILCLFICCFKINIFASSTYDINQSLDEKSETLTNDDLLDISDIADGSNKDASFSIQDYANSYVNMLVNDLILNFESTSNTATQLTKNRYAGKINFIVAMEL